MSSSTTSSHSILKLTTDELVEEDTKDGNIMEIAKKKIDVDLNNFL